MKVGDLVWNRYHSILRFGTVQNKRIDQNGWAHFVLAPDETYEKQ